MTHSPKARPTITGPVKITVKGPQGSGKTQLINSFAATLKSLGLDVVIYDSNVPRSERRWRPPFKSNAVQVMIVEKQTKSRGGL